MITDGIVVLYIFLVGAVFGSFLNVVLYRMRSGRTLLGRSSCGSCGRILSPIDLIPVVSFLLLNGRCRTCSSKISFQYPLVEAVTGGLFVLSFLGATTYYEFVMYALLSCLSVLIGTYDLRHTIIPAIWNYAFWVLALLFHAPHFLDGSEQVIQVLSSGVILFAVFWFTWWISGGRAVGYGDVLLVFGIGVLLGTFPAFIAVWVACITGSVYGVSLMAHSYVSARRSAGKVTLKSKIPFGPFLLFGTLIALVYLQSILNFLLSLTT